MKEENCPKMPVPMQLMRGRLVGYDADRMVLEFTMMHGARIVDCEMSGAALDDLADVKGTRPGERAAQFALLRDVIERVASDTFVAMGMPQGVTIRIFSKHVKGQR